jgi:hypothetical protein
MPSTQKNIALEPQEVLKIAQRTLVESTDVQAGKSKFAAKIDSAEARRTTDEAYFMKSASGRISPAAGYRASGELSEMSERFASAASGSLRLLAEAASQGVGLMLNYDAATKESFGGDSTVTSKPNDIMRAAGSTAVAGILTTSKVGMFAIDMGNELAQFAFSASNYTADVLAAAGTSAARGVYGAAEFVADTT